MQSEFRRAALSWAARRTYVYRCLGWSRQKTWVYEQSRWPPTSVEICTSAGPDLPDIVAPLIAVKSVQSDLLYGSAFGESYNDGNATPELHFVAGC